MGFFRKNTSTESTRPPKRKSLSCLSCRWADPRVGDEGDTFIQCRRVPPAVVGGTQTFMDEETGEEIYVSEPMVIWPQVTAEDFCGEWESK